MSAPCECRVTVGDANDDQVLGFDTSILHCSRHSEAHVAQLEADRDQLTLDVEDRDVLVARLKGEWPATDGSPMGIMQAKLEAMTRERDALQAIANEAALTVARLEAEIVGLRQRIEAASLGGQLDLPRMIARLEETVEFLEGALTRYGRHEPKCPVGRWQGFDPALGENYAGTWYPKGQAPPCSCGFTAAVEGR